MATTGIYTGYGTITPTISRGNAGVPGATPAAAGPVYKDEQDNYYKVIDGKITNVGWDQVGDPAQAIPLRPDQYGSWRSAAGLAPGTPSTADTNAKAQLKLLLDQWDLGSLAEWAWTKIAAGTGQDQVLLELRDQQAYKERFGNTNAARTKAGLQALSEAEILAYEKQRAQLMKAAGLPAGFYDSPDDAKRDLINDVSISETAKRIDYAKRLTIDDPSVLPEEARAMRDLYGLGNADLAAYILDPGKALPLIEKQINAAQNAAAARIAGFGTINAAEAERVGGLTSSAQQAAQGFQQLARMRELFNPLPGEAGAQQITVDQQIEAQFGGNADAQNTISRRQRARQAAFDARSGDYSKNGLGKATTAAL